MLQNSFQEIREAVRALCRAFESSYWQKADEERNKAAQALAGEAEQRQQASGERQRANEALAKEAKAALDRAYPSVT